VKNLILLTIILISQTTYPSKETQPKEQAKESLAQELTQKLKEARKKVNEKSRLHNSLGRKADNGQLNEQGQRELVQCDQNLNQFLATAASLTEEMKKNGIPVPENKVSPGGIPRNRGDHFRPGE